MSHVLKELWKQPGIRLIFALSLYLSLSPFLPSYCHQFFYSLSLTIKSLLLWLMPLIVLFYVAYTIQSFKKKAPLFLCVLLVFEGFSNFFSVWYSYGLGVLAKDFMPPLGSLQEIQGLKPLWTFPWQRPLWYGADKASLLGVVMGLMCLSPFEIFLKKNIEIGKKWSQNLLIYGFRPIIPLFIVGFVANLSASGSMKSLYIHLATIMPWLCFGLSFYIAILFFLSARQSFRKMWKHMRHMAPAGALALSSGCSLSTMPWTIEGTRKNLRQPDLADAIIPATTNIQQIGDCIANSFLCYILYTQFMGAPPALTLWIPFSVVFTLARFTTAAVLGGAVFIMLPIYETYLHFTPTMIALMLAFNVIMDPIITSANVMANGALCSVFERLWEQSLKLCRYAFP